MHRRPRRQPSPAGHLIKIFGNAATID